MNMNQSKLWDQLRTAYQPSVPDLDTTAIMAAVHREAAARPLGRAAPSPVAAIPTWACAVAASLAILATTWVAYQSVPDADQQIGHAWMNTVQPEEFAQTFLSFTDDSSL